VNNGPAGASGISIINNFDNSTITTANPRQGSCNLLDTTTVSCDIGTLGSGTSTTVTVMTKPVKIGTASSSVTLLRANQSDADITNNTDSVQILVVDNSGDSSAGSLSYALLILSFLGLAIRRIS